MKKETLKKMCEAQELNYDDVVYNCGDKVEDLRLYGGKIYHPRTFIYGKPYYTYAEHYEVILEDCV